MSCVSVGMRVGLATMHRPPRWWCSLGVEYRTQTVCQRALTSARPSSCLSRATRSASLIFKTCREDITIDHSLRSLIDVQLLPQGCILRVRNYSWEKHLGLPIPEATCQ